MKVYADLVNHGRTPKFTPVLDDYARSFVDHTNPEALDKAIVDVQVCNDICLQNLLFF
jgi:hypothetical protein